GAVVGVARTRRASGQGFGDRQGQGSGDPHDAHPAPTLGGGNGGDGVTALHGRFSTKQNAPKTGRLQGLAVAPAYLAAASICRVMYHCWAMDRMLLTTQYSTRPAGNHRKKKVKMIGSSFITRACMGSGGVGLSCCWRSEE